MKFKLRNILIGTGIAVLGVAAAGAAVGISDKKSDKPDTSDTVSENLDLINLIEDLQSQINSVNTENEQIKNQLNSVNTENQKLNNKTNQLTESLTELESENSTLKTQVGQLVAEDANSNYLHCYEFFLYDISTTDDMYISKFNNKVKFYKISDSSSALFNDNESFISYLINNREITLYSDKYITFDGDFYCTVDQCTITAGSIEDDLTNYIFTFPTDNWCEVNFNTTFNPLVMSGLKTSIIKL